jgi:hypothetical protein
MSFPVEIWLRGDNHASTQEIAPVTAEPAAWSDGDVARVLAGMLRALEHARNPASDLDRPIALRGFSWIVSPFESGGVVIAIELSLGAVVGGPFQIAESRLSAMIERVVAADRAEARTVH